MVILRMDLISFSRWLLLLWMVVVYCVSGDLFSFLCSVLE